VYKILSMESDTEGYSNGCWVFGRDHECTKYCLCKVTQKGTLSVCVYVRVCVCVCVCVRERKRESLGQFE